jgi:hypothetical protein
LHVCFGKRLLIIFILRNRFKSDIELCDSQLIKALFGKVGVAANFSKKLMRCYASGVLLDRRHNYLHYVCDQIGKSFKTASCQLIQIS